MKPWNRTEWKSGDAYITGDWYGNRSGKRTILFCHGFPGTNRLEGLKRALPKAWTLVEIHYRGDKDAGGVFTVEGAVEDVLAAARAIRTQCAPQRLSALGYSAGAWYVVGAAVRKPELFSQIVLLNPVVNSYMFSDAPIMPPLWRRAKRMLRLHALKWYRERFARIHRTLNPLHLAEKIRTPVIVVQSDNDTVVSPPDTRYFYELVPGKKQYVVIKHGNHDVSGAERGLLKVFS